MDSALLAHPLVTEAVSFGAPDEKYGESVAAAVVLSKPVEDEESTIADIKKAAASKLSKFKVGSQPRPSLSCSKGSEGVRWGPCCKDADSVHPPSYCNMSWTSQI